MSAGWAIVAAVVLALVILKGRGSRELYSEIAIEGSASRVWAVLTDIHSYPDWNPFLSIQADALEPGRSIQVHVQPANGGGMSFRPTVLTVEPERQLRWLGRLWGIPGLFDGDHRFELESLGPDRTRFIQREHFSGILVPFLRSMLDRSTLPGFEIMNQALKRRVESGEPEVTAP